jgi:phosphohistidine swiveling domain-containing protein
VTFDPPEMAMLPFQQDRQHVPAPMTPLAAWYAAQGFAVGASRAMAAYEVPMAFTVGHFNYYYYMAIAPNVPPEELPGREAAAQAALMPAVGQFRERWEREWLPELESTWAEWERFDLAAASLPRLAERLDECLALFQRIWEIHFLLLVPAMVGFSEFRELYGQLFPGGGELDAYKLLQGFDNKSLQADRAFWDLSQAVDRDEWLRSIVVATAADELGAVLAASERGREFLETANAVLAQWGRRSDTVQELGDASWTEDPRPLFAQIKACLEKGEDPQQRHQSMAAEREAAVAVARQKLAGQPPEVLGAFEALLGAAQNTSFIQEDHNYWIDQRGLHEVRQVCMEVGRKLAAAGQLASADDVFMFSTSELKDLIATGASDAETAASRRTEIEHWRTVVAPPMVGTDYGPPPDNPITRAIMRFFGGPPPASDERTIRGNAGSAGSVRGVARLVMSLDEADELAPGEILVAPTTSPPWTALFGIAAAVVTDTGGALSHCAIVAREYGIPAVVGTGVATARIRSGQMIEVDGSNGVVRLL